MTGKPAISFVIAARNAAATLSETLSALYAQTRRDWQAIIVDDGSTDQTATIAQAAAKIDPRIEVYSTDPNGASAARNFGLSKAEAQWICFLDADDWIGATFCEIMLRASDESVDLIYCGYERIAPDGRSVLSVFSKDFETRGFELAARECPTAIHAIIVRRSLVNDLGGFDAALVTCEEWDLWQRAARVGARIRAVPQVLAKYRMSEGSLSCQYQQVVLDGHTVIRRGFSRDPRVARPLDIFAEGAQGSDQAIRCSYLAAWYAAAAVGAGGEGAALLDLAGPLDFGGHVDIAGTSIAQALAIGAKTRIDGLAEKTLLFERPFKDVLDAMARSQRKPEFARGLAYAVDRAIMQSLPERTSAALRHTAKSVIDLADISEVSLPDRIDTLVIEFVSSGHSCGTIEIAVFGALSKLQVAELAFHVFGRRALVRLCALHRRSSYWLKTISFSARALASAGLNAFHRKFRRPFMIRRALRLALRRAALEAASGTQISPADEMVDQAPARPPETTARIEASQIRDTRLRGDEKRALRWDHVFAKNDPWNYGSDYEQRKYEQTLDLLPDAPIERALELACAEGMFTPALSSRVETLIAADISTTALARARERCRGIANIMFQQLDLIAEEIPAGQNLIVCSEVLYFLDKADDLSLIATKLRDALVPGGRLLMAHAFLLKDDMSATGFDWEQDYGGKVIHATFAATPGLVLERSIVTELYRVDCFKRSDELSPPAPVIRPESIASVLDPDLTRQIVWGGAYARRHDLIACKTTWHLPILTYHRIASEGPSELADWRVHPDRFREQLRLLRAHGYYSITSADILRHKNANRPFAGRPVLITFDDGYQDFAHTAWPILNAEGFTAEVFLVTDLIGQTALWDARFGEPARLMDWPTIAGLQDKGVAFGSHLATHTPATWLSSKALRDEANTSRRALENALNTSIVSIAAPHGRADGRYFDIVRSAGFEIEFSGSGARADIRNGVFGVNRIDVRGVWTKADFARTLGITAMKPQDLSKTPVSVIIPAYDAEATIDETLRSARAQTHQNLEILVVDDGSRDSTAKRVAEHAAADERIRLIAQANAGVAAARNRAIAEARSDLIAPLDADDLWAPTKIEKQLRALMGGGDGAGLAYTWFAALDDRGRVTSHEPRPTFEGDVIRQICSGNFVGNGSSPLMKKAAILEAGGYDPGLRAAHAQGCEDLLLYFRIAECYEFALVPERLTGYRQTGAMSADATQMLRSYRIVAAEMREKYPQFQNEIHLGEAYIAEFFFRRALHDYKFNAAAQILLYATRHDIRHAFIILRRLAGRLVRSLNYSSSRQPSEPEGSFFTEPCSDARARS